MTETDAPDDDPFRHEWVTSGARILARWTVTAGDYQGVYHRHIADCTSENVAAVIAALWNARRRGRRGTLFQEIADAEVIVPDDRL